jgi:hypothetical protein
LGLRVKFNGGAESDQRMVPYVSAAADYRVSNSTLTGLDSFTAPRFGFGVKGKLGRGDISVDVDFGQTRSDTFDRGIKFGYELKF